MNDQTMSGAGTLTAARPRRFAVVVNPHGGTRRGLSVLEMVRPRFAAAGAELEVHITQYAGHAAELARTLDFRSCHGVCVIGGDGTVHEVANGLLQREPLVSLPLGLIPAGTGNAVLQHLGCYTPEEAAERILAGVAQPLDVARLSWPGGTFYCLNIIGWGSVVEINRTAERWRWLGRPRYTLAALWQILRARRRHARLVLDDQPIIDDDLYFVLACNTQFTGNGMRAAPRADTADGKIDVMLVRHASRRQMLQMFQRVFDGSHLALSCVEYHQVRSFRLETDGPELLNLDGELKGHSPVDVQMLPGALQVFA